MPGKSTKSSQSKKLNGDNPAQPAPKVAAEETPTMPKTKSKNLNVVEEFEKSGMKRMSNFVVIGMPLSIDAFAIL
jgi:elongation factor 1 alpha-like protein